MEEWRFDTFLWYCENCGEEELAKGAEEFKGVPELFTARWGNLTYRDVYEMEWREVEQRLRMVIEEAARVAEALKKGEEMAKFHPLQMYENYVMVEP